MDEIIYIIYQETCWIVYSFNYSIVWYGIHTGLNVTWVTKWHCSSRGVYITFVNVDTFTL